MCGRFTLSIPPELLAELFHLPTIPKLLPRYNIAPTQDVAIVRRNQRGAGRILRTAKWGLIPAGSKDARGAARMINARHETVFEKSAFRQAARVRRCLVPADGFYEWVESPKGGKDPLLIRLSEHRPFAMAGVWEEWRAPEGHTVDTCAVLTTEPNELVIKVHDRMPVIIEEKDFELWMDPKIKDRAVLEHLFRPFPAERMTADPVSRLVNSVDNDDPRCIELQTTVEIEEAPKEKPASRQLGFDFV